MRNTLEELHWLFQEYPDLLLKMSHIGPKSIICHVSAYAYGNKIFTRIWRQTSRRVLFRFLMSISVPVTTGGKRPIVEFGIDILPIGFFAVEYTHIIRKTLLNAKRVFLLIDLSIFLDGCVCF